MTKNEARAIGHAESCDYCGFPFDPGAPITTDDRGLPYCGNRCRLAADLSRLRRIENACRDGKPESDGHGNPLAEPDNTYPTAAEITANRMPSVADGYGFDLGHAMSDDRTLD